VKTAPPTEEAEKLTEKIAKKRTNAKKPIEDVIGQENFQCY
jgi:hypothetical protein